MKFAMTAGLVFSVLAVLISGILDAVLALVYYHVTVPGRCAVAQPDGSIIHTRLSICKGVGPELAWGTGLVFGVAVLMWLLTLIIYMQPEARRAKLKAWADKPREASPSIVSSRYISSVSAITPSGTRVGQKCCLRGHRTPDAAARHAAGVKLRIERRGS
jgi:hypothetical protein